MDFHNKVNYNDRFSFQNIECNQHLQRDLQKNTDDTRHKWSDKLKKLISSTIHERKEAIIKGEQGFQPKYIEKFKKKLARILKKGRTEYAATSDSYSSKFENALLNRLDKFHNNYFSWVEDFKMPTTDNLAERGLRCVKSHMKISGQFENVNTAGYFSTIKTYIETCRKNGINEMVALTRLCCGNPYTVAEIFTR